MYAITNISTGKVELSFHATDKMNEEPECAICLSNYAEDLKALKVKEQLARLCLMRLSCSHIFHEACGKKYLNSQRSAHALVSRNVTVTCPICRGVSHFSPSLSQRVQLFGNWLKTAEQFEV